MSANYTKAIYGLRQTPQACYTELCTFLLNNGFSNSKCDTSLFIQHTFTMRLYLLVCADEIIARNNDHANQVFVEKLVHRFF
jgi:hypothetical protein